MSEEGFEEFQRAAFEAMKIPDAPKMHVDPDELVFGTPRQVADEIIRQCRALGVGNFVATFNIFEPGELRRTHELYGREVIPLLRAAEIG